MKSGKPVLEDVFSSGAQLHPFFYLCHLTTALEYCEVLFSGIDRALSLCNIALINAVCCTYLSVINRVTLYPRPKNLDESFWLSSFFVTNAPIQFQNHLAEKRNTQLSLDGKWIAVKYGDDIKLFERKSKKHQLFDYGNSAYVISGVVDFAFVYCTRSCLCHCGQIASRPISSDWYHSFKCVRTLAIVLRAKASCVCISCQGHGKNHLYERFYHLPSFAQLDTFACSARWSNIFPSGYHSVPLVRRDVDVFRNNG